MASLTEHLRRPDDHGRLAFHAHCPLCCAERLAGPIPTEAVMGRRTQAVLAAGVLALSSATPTAALATEPDEEHEGATAPEQVAPEETLSDPGFDPGGEPAALRFDVAAGPVQASPDPAADTGAGEAVPQAPAESADDTGPVEQEPATDEDAPIADPGDGSGPETAPDQQSSPSADPPPTPSATEPTTASDLPASLDSTPPSDVTVGETPPTTPVEPETDRSAPARERKREAAHDKQRRTHASTPSSTPTPAPQPEPVSVSSDEAGPATAQPTRQQPTSGAVTHGRAAQRGDRFHVVQQGESLWSIARDLLGDGASNAHLAREVNRLWELNSARIGTGEPDLVIAGTRIALR